MLRTESETVGQLRDALSRRILVIEGPKGTEAQARGLEESGYRGQRFADHPRPLQNDTDVLSLTRPDLVSEIHHAYLEAGADICTSNTFTATAISQLDFGLQDFAYEMNRAGAEIASRASEEWSERTPEKPRFCAGPIGPLNRSLSLATDVDDPGRRSVSFDEVRDSYASAVRGLLDGGIEILLLETAFDTLNAKAAIVAIEDVFEEKGRRLPLCISGTIFDRSGRTLSGQTLEAFWISVEHARPFSIGLNCSLGATELRPYIRELSRISPVPVSCYPNAGLPNAFGSYDEPPETTARLLREFAENGWVNLVGGCCGTTPEYIRAIARAVADVPPRPLAERRVGPSRYAGLEPLVVGGQDGRESSRYGPLTRRLVSDLERHPRAG